MLIRYLVKAAQSIAGGGDAKQDVARKALRARNMLISWQEAFTAIEKCPQPVIAAVHGGCIGGGMDLISCCDIRMSEKKTFFSVKEVDIGLAADLGTLQRFPKIVGNQSFVREVCYTGRRFSSAEAMSVGFVSGIASDREDLLAKANSLAKLIASKSPVAVTGTKVSLNYARDHSVDVRCTG